MIYKQMTQSRETKNGLLPKSVEDFQLGKSFTSIGSNKEANKNDNNHEMIKIIFQDIKSTTWLNSSPEKVVFSGGEHQTS